MLAVLDCGTNTFNLAIVEYSPSTGIKYVYNDRIPVKLGEGGIDKGFISIEAFERGIQALVDHQQTIRQFKVQQIIALGTAALRDASNGQAFLSTCKLKTGIDITLITGEREAELIWLAAKSCCPLNNNFIVMDIGGGSTEFIIGNTQQIHWEKSYRVGVSRLKESFGIDYTNQQKSIDELEEFIQNTLHELPKLCETYNVQQMIGTAGSFDTYANVLTLQKTGQPFDLTQKTYRFFKPELLTWCNKIIHAPYDFIHTVDGVPSFRKEFMSYSCLLTKAVIEACKITDVWLSSWSLKEGMILAHYNPK